MPQLKLTVNGVDHTLDVPANRYLAQVLRYDLGLTGTKIGCNEAECGACTVIVNGQSVDSCIYPAFKAQNATVLTIEGLAAEWRTAQSPNLPISQSLFCSRYTALIRRCGSPSWRKSMGRSATTAPA